MPLFRGTRLPLLSGGPVVAAGANWWDPDSEGLSVWAAYAPKGAADLAASYVDLSGNGNNTGLGVAPTWDAVNGWIFNGTTQYLTTTFLPQNDQSQTAIVQFTDYAATAQHYLCGCRTGNVARFYLMPAAVDVYYGNGGYSQQIPKITAGNLAVAGNQGYRNGVADGASINPDAVVPVYPLWIGAGNLDTVPTLHIDAYIQALAIYDTALTADQVSAIATAMAAL